MQLTEKIKESTVSVLPIIAIVCLLHCTVASIGDALPAFLVGGILVILGLGIFLLGTELGMVPIGQKAGAALTSKKNVPLLIGAGFLIGFLITIAEPDVLVLATQVAGVDPSISPYTLIFMIAIGVGFFVSVAIGRILLHFPFKLTLLFFYLIVFAVASLTDPTFLGIGFDAGGATTGPMTVPFIIALGVGVARVQAGKKSEEDSFGFIGLASIGPILAVLILGLFFDGSQTQQAAQTATESTQAPMTLAAQFLHLVPEVFHEVAIALGPLVLMFIVFQKFLIKMPKAQVIRMSMGLIYTFIGLILFFTGVKGGFMPAGSLLGASLASLNNSIILVPIGLLLGAVVVCAEPAVWVLNGQVEEISGGHIKKIIMLASLAIGVSVAVSIAMIRVLTGLSLWWFLIPGYALALGLTRFCPQMFTAIAFDSGGVASGPMASTFILAFALGASAQLGGNPITDAFGVIAMIAMTPLITIQILGIMFHKKSQQALERKKRSGETTHV